jgi:DNA topoisomerase-1
LNRAVTLIAEKKANPGKGRRFGADPGKVLGEHPDKGGNVVVKNGRYGPYVSHDGVNATLTGDLTPETITLEQALTLIEARAAKGGGKPAKRRAAGRKKPGEASEADAPKAKKARAPAKKKAAPKKAAKPKATKVDAAE